MSNAPKLRSVRHRHHRGGRARYWFEFLERFELLSGTPLAPTGLVTQATSPSAITLAWTDNATDETGYEIQRGTFWWGSFSTIATVGPDVTSWTDSGLNAGDGYHYRVRAVNADGGSAWEEGGNSVATTPFARPGNTFFRSSTMQNNSGSGLWNYIDGVAVWGWGTWMKYSSFDFTNLHATRFTASLQGESTDSTLEIWIDDPTGGTLIGTLNVVAPGNYTTLKSNSTSIASVTGVHDVYLAYKSPSWQNTNFRSFSFASNLAPVNTVPGGQLVSQSSTLVFSAGNGNAISVSDPDNDDNLVRITLAVSTGKISLATTDHLTLLSGTGTNDTSVTFEAFPFYLNAALASITYTPNSGFTGLAQLTLTSNDLGFSGGGGALFDVDTVAINVTSADPIPAVPTNVHGTAVSETGIQISWTDGSNNETGFEIQRATLGGNFATVTSVAANTNSWTDAGLTANTTYRYRVRAVNASGASNWSGSGYDLATPSYRHPISTRFQANAFQDSGGTYGVYSNGVALWSDGAWLKYSDFDFTNGDATRFSLSYETPVDGNAMEVRVDSPTGPILGTVSITSSGGYSRSGMLTTTLAAATGVHDLYVVYRNLANWSVNVHAFSFGPNSVPTLTGPGSAILLKDTPLVFSSAEGTSFAIEDSDSDSLGVKITLKALHGSLTLHSTTGLAFTAGDGANDGTLTFTGNLYDITTALEGMVYQPNAGFTGQETLTVTVNDLGFTGYGGPQTVAQTVSINVRNSVVIPNAPSYGAAEAISDTAIRLTWIDNSPDDTGFEIQRTPIGQVHWTTIAVTAPHTASYDDAGLAPEAGYLYRIRARNDSGFSAWTGDGHMVATTRYLHDTQKPFLARDAQSQSDGIFNSGWDISGISEGSWIAFGTFDFSQGAGGITAVAASTTSGLVLEVHLDGPSGMLLGQLAIGNTGDLSHLRNFSGALAPATGVHDVYIVFHNANFNTLLNGLSFATNRAPVVQVPGTQITPRGTPLFFSADAGNRIDIVDDDNASLPETVTLVVTHGRLSLSQTTNLTFETGDGTGDASMTFTGSIAAIHAALADMVFTPDARFSGTALLSLLANDLGATGYGGPLTTSATVEITVSSLDLAPILLVPAHSNSAVVSMATVPLDVTASDDNGEENLTYTWTCVNAPANGSVTFSNNNNHEASHSVATFSKPGTYALSVTISDGHNLTISTVLVTYTPLPDVPLAPHGAPDPVTPAPPAPKAPEPDSAGRTAKISRDSETSFKNSETGPSAPHQFTGGGSTAPAGTSSPATGFSESAVSGHANGAPVPAATATITPAGVGGNAPTPNSPAFMSIGSGGAQGPAPVSPSPKDLPDAPKAVAEAHKSIYDLIEQPITVQSPAPEAQQQEQQLAATVEKQIQTHKVVNRVVGTIASVSGAASVGYLIWIARGGSLLLSMLTSVPMWRFLDPLPVLNSVEPRQRRTWWKRRKKVQQPITDHADEPLEHLTD